MNPKYNSWAKQRHIREASMKYSQEEDELLTAQDAKQPSTVSTLRHARR